MKLADKNLYYVGGVVRDKLLGIKSIDVDYCYEGNAIEFAEKLGLEIIKKNPDFGTVKIVYKDKLIDIASTRKEFYPRKGHLPVVTEIGCSLEDDLKRRDFTINSMAIRTSDEKFFDFFGGVDDINNKKLRVLHENSFIDDPSRIIRALKFSVRFNFTIADLTKAYQNEYLSNINYDLSYHRLKKELIETFSLNNQRAFDIFVEQELYKLLGPTVQKPNINTSIENLINNNPCENIWIVYLGLFNLSNFALTKKEKNIIENAKNITKKSPIESVLIYKLRTNKNDV